MTLTKIACVAAASLAVLIGAVPGAHAQPSQSSQATRPAERKSHLVVIQVSQNEPAVMTMALNNAENLAKYYKAKGEEVEIEFVAYGAGLSMVRDDTSPVKERLAAIGSNNKNITFSGCDNTRTNQSKMENKEIGLVPQARLVPSGIARIVELQEQGWTYVRP
jgi:intracellular sulfur oxidation DsrE/DsrF family protein